MNKLASILALGLMLFCCVAPALAQGEGTDSEPAVAAAPVAAATADSSFFGKPFGAAFGCGMIIIGAGFGIAKIGSAAVDSMARQPEVAGSINTAMIISAALIEGATFFGLIVCLLTMILKY